MNPTVSIIVASYNFGRFIAAALESVRLQTMADFEAIVVDDGSTDDSLAIIGQFLDDDRIRLVRQKHGGQARAKNRGMDEARGHFVAFLDADDYWQPHKLERQLSEFADSSVGVVFSRRSLIDESGRPLGVRAARLPSGVVLDEMFRQNFICFSSAIMRREVIEHVGRFDERLDLAIDYDFWLRVAQHYAFAYVDEPLAAYRIGHDNLSRRQLDRLQTAQFVMQRFLKCYGGERMLDRRAIHRAEAETLTHLGLLARGYSRTTAISCVARALRKRPFSAEAWRGLAAALLPPSLLRLIRWWRGRDGAWERHCFTDSNRPEAIL
jgi:glycosyltransferase involved in cell wall biosynthesis